MSKRCKACGAPLHNERCDYCGTTTRNKSKPQKSVTQQPAPQQSTSQQLTNTLNYDIPQNSMAVNNKLTINKVAGIIAVINVMVLTTYNIFLFGAINVSRSTETVYLIIGLSGVIGFLLMIASLVIHIVGLVQSRKHGISTVGHILGIIGAGIALLTLTMLSFISVILFFLAAIFILMQKKVRPPMVGGSQSNSNYH